MSRIEISGYSVGPFQTNVYVLHREGSAETVITDPGFQGEQLAAALDRRGLHVCAILLTHAHYDHIGSVREMVEKTGARVYLSDSERHLAGDPQDNLSAEYGAPTTVCPDEYLSDGQEITLADISFRCIYTPGHTEGSCCYYIEDTGDTPVLLAGDTLFQESVGRTDMPTGSMSTLVRSIRERLLPLPDDTLVLPGHGGSTTIGYERENNPYL